MSAFAIVCCFVCLVVWGINALRAYYNDRVDWRMQYVFSCIFLSVIFAIQTMYYITH